MTLQSRTLDITANNMANLDTTGFKVESVMVQTIRRRRKRRARPRQPINYVLDTGTRPQFRPGPLEADGQRRWTWPSTGQGFFTGQTADGPRYTRDGRFTADPTGQR